MQEARKLARATRQASDELLVSPVGTGIADFGSALLVTQENTLARDVKILSARGREVEWEKMPK